MKRLREKIEDDPQHPAIIKTLRGLGYKAVEK
jgi:DNA-binding response OmpR family regulator